MKKVVYHILVLTYCAHLLMPAFVMVDYQIRKDYIATVLCENKATPELSCNGKCFLFKKLRKLEQEKKHQQEERLKLVLSQSDYVASELVDFSFSLNIITLSKRNNTNDRFRDSGIIDDLIKPPQLYV